MYVPTFEKGKKFHPEAKPHKNFFLSIHLEGMREKYTAGPQGSRMGNQAVETRGDGRYGILQPHKLRPVPALLTVPPI